ncbi:MAG: preprotein translocase subunit SecA, partial [Candidatus Parcubacteria bacterium]|nr:preprotein translocase subunit SecA [Candidatus Parcubacteria bacterium]
MSLLSILAGDANLKYINTKKDLVERINEAEKVWEKTSQIDLQKKSQELSGKIIAEGYSDDIIVDAFALAREAAKRTLNQRQFDVQILGGLALHEGKIVEMKTGEGKTLVATTAAYLNALEKKGVHIVTVNDYLAKRDMVWMGQIYYYLGVSVSCITQSGSFLYDPNYKMEQPEAQVTLDEKRDELASFKVFQEFLRPISRKEAYQADITYGTNSEFGFDYLRDNLVWDLNDRAQRGHHFVIIDEVDSILIDEARTPLIISVPDEDAGKMYSEFTRIVPRLEKDIDYTVDEKLKAISLTEEGLNKIESIFGINIFDEKGITAVHHLEEALKAHVLFLKDRDYIVKNDEILIVDEFTGRILEGRRYSGGLHQAIEAKEGVTIKQESRTAATITLQNYFRMYQKISGMTGTAATSAEEFHKVYGVDVVMIPTNKPMRRNDSPDQIYKTTEGKYRQIVQEVKRRHESGQPVLIGTVSIERNEYLGALLKREGIPFQILNAKNHEEEGAIIAQAGRKGSVTVATNMAGRGVDIILGGNPPDEIEKEKVIANGGLFVLGTERHEARRIDNQLRGRSGRQGDPGASQFFVSLEDDLMRVFGSKNIGGMMSKLGLTEDMAIQHPLISKGLETAQSKIEGYNFDLRKHILEYDDVFNKQRTAFYNRRMELLRLTEEKKLPEKILPELSEKLISLSEFWLNTDQDTFYHNLSNILPNFTKEEADELFVEDPDIRSKQIKEMFEKR